MISRNEIEKLKSLLKEIQEQKVITSELLRTAQDRFNHVSHKLTRDGKEIELTEKVLWQEVFLLGSGCQAAGILRQAHPEVFEAYDKQEKLAVELKKFTISELGMDYSAMTLADYVNLTEGIFALLMEEYKAKEA